MWCLRQLCFLQMRNLHSVSRSDSRARDKCAISLVVGMGNYGPAAAWLRNYAHALHAELAPRGVQVGHVAIGVFIGRQPGHVPADDLASAYWDLHTRRGDVERVFRLNHGAHETLATAKHA